MPRLNWQRDESLLALSLYCRLPFGQYHSSNSEIIKLAELIGRTPGAVAMKLSNFASFDPYHQSRGIKGLQNTSQADRKLWEEFNSNWEELAVESEQIYAQFANTIDDEKFTALNEIVEEPIYSSDRTEIERQVKIRMGQNFFRKVILTSYKRQCCICEMPLSALLVASHIIPWSNDKNLRVNPHNGLCLCVLHDKAFDRGLITIGEHYEVVIGRRIVEHFPNTATRNSFEPYAEKRIGLPDKFIPDQQFLAFHREEIFKN